MNTALVSATVTFTIFLLTQWWTYKRTRSEFLRGKLEALYMSLREILHETRPIDVSASSNEAHERLNASLNSTSLPEGLVRLYFPALSERMMRVLTAREPYHRYYRDIAFGTVDPVEQYHFHIGKSRLAEQVGELQQYLLDNQDELTEMPFRCFRCCW